VTVHRRKHCKEQVLVAHSCCHLAAIVVAAADKGDEHVDEIEDATGDGNEDGNVDVDGNAEAIAHVSVVDSAAHWRVSAVVLQV